jgi:hypothetical protein
MGRFKPLKQGQKRRVVLHTRGPRSKKEGAEFRQALLKLIKKHRTSLASLKVRKTSRRKRTRRR